MILSSPTFLMFLALAALVYYKLPQRFRAPFLLLASMVFYMWRLPAYGAVVLGTAGLGYFAAVWIAKSAKQKSRERRLALSISALLAVLVIFKYFNFFSSTVSALFGGEGAQPLLLSLAQPVGISFYTLQLIGYLVDVYRGEAPEREFVPYALFVTFFPQIISGPINRAGEMLPQYKAPKDYNYANVAVGGQRFLAGALKKIVVADGLGLMVDGVWGDLANASGWPMLLAAVFYSVQLYCDFSGYTDMALGAAKVLGFEMRENFNTPYLACGMTDFWSRWHMSLTSWLRDYIYIPLGGSRKGYARKLLNILIVFLISGLWHGAGLTFILWGLWHGVFRIIDDLLARSLGERYKNPRGLCRAGLVAATDIIVGLGWVLFRAPDLASAGVAFRYLTSYGPFSDALTLLQGYAAKGVFTDSRYFRIYGIFLALGFTLTVLLDIIKYRCSSRGERVGNPLGKLPKAARWAVYWAAGLSIAAFYMISLTGTASSSMFIYSGF